MSDLERLPVVSVVGRPNVGKSTLFNRILGRREAIVEEKPGVTRDRKVLEAEWQGYRFELVDTGGWMPSGNELDDKVSAQSERAISDSDLIVLVVDGTTGVTEEDARIGAILRKSDVAVLLAVNKIDSNQRDVDIWDFLSLGLGEPMGVSALHSRNTGDLLDSIVSSLPAINFGSETTKEIMANPIEGEIPGVAIVGRPNVGKSTLFNAIAGLLPLAHGSLKIKGMNPQEAKGLVAYVPQKDLINWKFSLSVKDVVEMGLTKKDSFNLFSRKKINETIKNSLDDVGLLHKIDESVNNLSGGQLQRVLIARALAQNADILLLDEAFSAVDVGAQEDIMKLINDINLNGKTILIATHDINNLEEKFDEVLCLNRHCCAFGDPSEVLTEEVIKEMYGSHNEMFKNHIKESHGINNDN